MILLNRRKYIHRRRPQGAPADLADAVVTLASETVYYTGNPVYPSVSVTYEGAALVVNTDYTLNYTDNTEIGAATVTVTGMGEYTGSVVKTFQIVSSVVPAGWADFDLSKLGDPVGSATLQDSTAYYESGANIMLYGIQTLPDDSIFFAAQAQGHSYIWGFDDGHAFDVSHFNSTFTSRSFPIGGHIGSVLGDGGTLLYDSVSDNGIYKTALSTAYQLPTEDTRTKIGNAGLLGFMPHSMQFSNDGSKFFYKDAGRPHLYQTELSTPWQLSSKGDHTFTNLQGLSNLPTSLSVMHAFLFSPDGKELLFAGRTQTLYEVDWVEYLIKVNLSTAYDLSTASVHSYKAVTKYNNPINGIAVNNAGTKLILFNGASRTFYEYNLSA